MIFCKKGASELKIIFIQLGSPKSPKIGDIRQYLKVFLSSKRIVNNIHPWIWKLILNFFILPFRPKKSAIAYKRIWNDESFALVRITQKFVKQVSSVLEQDGHKTDLIFLFGDRSFKDIFYTWKNIKSVEKDGDQWLIIPLFPQYCEATTGTAIDAFFGEIDKQTHIPSFKVITNFYNYRFFINNCACHIEKYLKKFQKKYEKLDALLLSFHGLPVHQITQNKDPYYQQCFFTYKLISQKISIINERKIHLVFQSRFGRSRWIGPHINEKVEQLINKGQKNLAVFCPSFLADCLETLDEIGFELREHVKRLGGKLYFIPCLNDELLWCNDFANFVKSHIESDQIIASEKKDNNRIIEIPIQWWNEVPNP